MGTLETPQIHKTGPPERNRQTEAQVEQGAQEAKAGGHDGRGLVPASTAGTFVPPKKKSMGQLRVSGALRGETHSKT